jgi:glycosyltransferase involved in cell wall biosynthesis
MPVDILHVTETSIGGVVSVLEELLPLQAADKRFGRVMLLAPPSALAAFHGKGIDCFPIDFNVRSVGGLYRLRKLIAQKLGEASPHILHLHSSFAGMAGRPLVRAAKRKPVIIYCAHAWSFARKGHKLANLTAKIVERLLARTTDRIICVSEGDRRAALGIGLPEQQLAVVLNGIADVPPPAASEVMRWPGDGVKLLFIGRYDEQKAYDVLMQAMAKLGGHASLLSVGDFADGAKQHVPAPANVRRLGWLPRAQIPNLLAQADILVMPSRWEGLPMAAIEAFRAARGVIGTRIDGLLEIIEHEFNGLIVPADNADALAQTIDSLTPSLCERLGNNARRLYLDRFTSQRMMEESARIYELLRT